MNAPTTTAPRAHTFDEVRAEVEARAARNLPDTTVAVAALAALPDGRLLVPGLPPLALNGWSRRQLGARLGIRLTGGKWMAKASEEARAQALTDALRSTDGEVKVRARGDLIRALVPASFTAIDDRRLFDVLYRYLGGLLSEWRFVRVEATDCTAHYTAARVEPVEGWGPAGWHLSNSEVGGSALRAEDAWMLPGGDALQGRGGRGRLLYRTHRAIENDQLASMLLLMFARLPERLAHGAARLARASTELVRHPGAAVGAALEDDAEVPAALAKEAAARVAAGASRLDVAAAIVEAARGADDADVRAAMERRAGAYALAHEGDD